MRAQCNAHIQQLGFIDTLCSYCCHFWNLKYSIFISKIEMRRLSKQDSLWTLQSKVANQVCSLLSKINKQRKRVKYCKKTSEAWFSWPFFFCCLDLLLVMQSHEKNNKIKMRFIFSFFCRWAGGFSNRGMSPARDVGHIINTCPLPRYGLPSWIDQKIPLHDGSWCSTRRTVHL